MRAINDLKAIQYCILLACLAFCSCAQQNTKPTVAENTLAEALLEKDVVNDTPDFIDDALFLAEAPAGFDPALEERFDVSVKGIDAQSFFLSLVSNSKSNIVAHPEVSGLITLELSNVTVTEVLNVVRDVYGYEYNKQDSIYTIYPRKLRTEIFAINYIDIKRVGVSDTTVTIGEVESNNNQNGQSTNSTGSSKNSANFLGMGDDSSTNTQGGQGISPGSRVQTLNKTDFWGTLDNTITKIIGSPAEGRSVIVNPQAGLVVVSAMPNEIHAVRNFLERSELSVKRQVVLETQIVEVQLSEGFQAGINWSAIQGEMSFGSEYGRSKIVEGGNVVEDIHQYGPRFVKSVFSVFDIQDFLSLLETQGSVQVLSSPRVSTVNNQKAVIRVGSDEFFVTGVKNNTTSTAATTTFSPELELTSFFSGISLDVTPQISDSGDVILHIHPIVSEVNDQIKEVSIGESKITLPLAHRDIRESDSIVRAKSGQVIVLGGLMQHTDRREEGKQPWLGNVPGLNLFFKNKNNQSRKTELVILLKPTVVDGHTWKNQLQQFRDSSAAMGTKFREQ